VGPEGPSLPIRQASQAIRRVPDTESGLEKWLELNAEYAKVWPNITQKGPPPPDAKEFEGVPDKFSRFFSDKPGGGS